MKLSRDKFLGGQLTVQQPLDGYRAATDPVFMAASVPAKSGDSILELGCGVGVALLCLHHRVPDANYTGLELQAEYASLCRQNFDANNACGQIICGDLNAMPAELRAQSFDHVMFNPPFYSAGKASKPYDAGRAQSHVTNDQIGEWISAGLKRLRPKGTLTLIHRTDALPVALAGMIGRAGDIRVQPLTARDGRPAKRVIISCRKGSKGETKLLPPFVIHAGSQHPNVGQDYSNPAEGILRHGQALSIDA